MRDNKLRSVLYRFAVMFPLLCLSLLVICTIPAAADGDTEDSNWVHYVGVGIGRVNVRTGPGEEYDKVTDASGKALQITAQEEVEIMGEKKNSSGKVWYNIRFERDGVIYEGFSTSAYISKDESRIITPTPIPTATPVPTLSPTPLPPPTESPTPIPLIQQDKDSAASNSGRAKVVLAIALILSAAFILALCFVVYMILNSRSNRKMSAAMRKVDKLKRMNAEAEKAGHKAPVIRNVDDNGPVTEEVPEEVYVKSSSDDDDDYEPSRSNGYKEPEEKRALRAAIENLREHDLVYHVIYGEGEVSDNSDVKLLEVKFGNDVRFLKKEQLIARKELKIIDDEEQSVARRRRKK